MTTYVANRPFTVGSQKIVDVDEFGHETAEVLSYEEGDVVPGAENFDNLGGLVLDGFLVAKGSAAKAEGAQPKAPRKRTSAKRTSAKRTTKQGG